LIEDLLRRSPGGEEPVRTLEVGHTQSIVVAVQRGNGRRDGAAVEPAQEALRLLVDHRLGFAHRMAAGAQVVLHDIGELNEAGRWSEYVVLP
jgi:hypothetical protein